MGTDILQKQNDSVGREEITAISEVLISFISDHDSETALQTQRQVFSTY